MLVALILVLLLSVLFAGYRHFATPRFQIHCVYEPHQFVAVGEFWKACARL